MPLGAAKNKKKKAAKRKNQKMAVDIPGDNQQKGSPPSPNRSSDFLSPQVGFQGNRHERRRSAIDEDFEETFETPRFQPETSRFPLEPPYYSMKNLNLKNGRSEVNVLLDESSKSLNVEIPLKEVEESSKEMKSEESVVAAEISGGLHQEILSEEVEEGEKDDHDLKEMKSNEKEEETPDEREVLFENSDENEPFERDVILEKSKTKLDENEEESSVKEEEVMLEKSEAEDVLLIEKSVPVDEERTPSISIEKVDLSSSNEKEVKIVPWPDMEIPAGNGFVNADVEIVCFEKGGDGDGNRNLERELNFERGVMGNKQPFPVDENLKDVVGGMLPQIDVDLTNNKFDTSVEKISVSAENSALITEEASHGGKAPDENSECLVGKRDASPRRRMNTAAEPSSDAEKTGIVQTDKVARGLGGTRHAKVWTCCGLFDVFTSSDR